MTDRKFDAMSADRRQRRSLHVIHAEAFQLMLYRRVPAGEGLFPNIDEAKVAEAPDQLWFWNSRDGVTPFGTSISGVEYRHAIRGYPTDYSAILPDRAQFVWVSYTPASWEEMHRRRYQQFANLPDDQEYGGAHFRGRYPSVEDWLAIVPFEHGQPRQLTREEFLESTPEWMGKPESNR